MPNFTGYRGRNLRIWSKIPKLEPPSPTKNPDYAPVHFFTNIVAINNCFDIKSFSIKLEQRLRTINYPTLLSDFKSE